MRKIVLQMMTTVNGRLDDPAAWATGVPGDLYAELDRMYGTFDTILVGRTTYDEMFAYWPGAGTAEDTPDAGRRMASKMNSYKKYVFTRGSETAPLEWTNAELVSAASDADVVAFVEDLKAQAGADIHLSGGAQLAQSIVRLGLVDRFHLVVHPVVSPGARWFDAIREQRELDLVSATPYSNGVVGLYYEPREAS
jgi:dihydrofolate reductase